MKGNINYQHTEMWPGGQTEFLKYRGGGECVYDALTFQTSGEAKVPKRGKAPYPLK